MKTNEQARQEAIKSAWGSERWKDFGDKVSAYGWLDEDWLIDGHDLSDCVCDIGAFIGFDDFTNYYRPKSLQGIDTNNGWTRIEPDGSNLPPYNSGTKYDCYTEKGNRLTLNGANAVINAFRHSDVTHYCPVPPPIPDPIY